MVLPIVVIFVVTLGPDEHIFAWTPKDHVDVKKLEMCRGEDPPETPCYTYSNGVTKNYVIYGEKDDGTVWDEQTPLTLNPNVKR